MSKVAAAGVVIALTLGIAIGYLLLPMIFPVNSQLWISQPRREILYLLHLPFILNMRIASHPRQVISISVSKSMESLFQPMAG
ncbi:MAG: hypothetical protein ACTSYB_04190 [Candidatus Helarchaeota archaeon]